MSGIVSWFRAALDAFGITIPPASTSTSDPTAAIAAYLEANSISLGPMLRTGGVLHRITPATAHEVAAAIVASAAKYSLPNSLVTSIVENESRGDPLAVNPNRQDAKPGETPTEAFAHTDEGVAQLDGATLEAMPENRGETVAQIEEKATTPTWAIDHLCELLKANIKELSVAMRVDPSLLRAIPGGDARIAWANSYNAGVHGTIATLRSATPNLKYGEQVVTRARALSPSIDREVRL